jgi:hypothetical protein
VAKSALVAPPLPSQIPGEPWLVLSTKWGGSAGGPRAHIYYFDTITTTIPPLNALQTGLDWTAHCDVLNQAVWSQKVYNGPTSVWCWDGLILHTGRGGFAATQGGLVFADRDITRCVLIQKLAFDDGWIRGRWWGSPVNSRWANPNHTLTNDGKTQFGAVASFLFQTPFTSQGTAWTPKLFSLRSGKLLDILEVKVFPSLHYLRKRRRDVAHNRPFTYPPFSPPPIG